MKTYDEVQDAVDSLHDLICSSKNDGEYVIIYVSFGEGDGYCRFIHYEFVPGKGIEVKNRQTIISSLEEFYETVKMESYETLTQISPVIEDEIYRLVLSSQIGDVPKRRAINM